MRPSLRAVPALLFLFAGGLAHARGAAPVSIHAFRPTQMEIGRQAVTFRVETWKAEARQQGLSLRDYAQQVLQPKFAKLELSTIIDPDGHYRNTDAHHRISALREVARLTGVELRITPKIIADYRGHSFTEYAQHFVEQLGKGQFTPEVEGLPVAERMRRLPSTYAGLRDNPMRSALEIVFERNGISGSWMKDYVEFRASRKLVDEGLLDTLKKDKLIPRSATQLPAQLASDGRVLDVIQRRIANKDVRRWLLEEALSHQTRQLLADKLDALE